MRDGDDHSIWRAVVLPSTAPSLVDPRYEAAILPVCPLTPCLCAPSHVRCAQRPIRGKESIGLRNVRQTSAAFGRGTDVSGHLSPEYLTARGPPGGGRGDRVAWRSMVECPPRRRAPTILSLSPRRHAPLAFARPPGA